MTIFNVISLFGGLALFLYGMRLMGDALKEGSSGALKQAMEKVTNNSFVGFVLGMIVTAVIQSSTATIVLTSGLVGAGILTLRQSIGIVLGANVGTTITGQIIRLLDLDAGGGSWLNVFKPSTLAPLAALIGIIMIMAVNTKHSNMVGRIAMGFGILFTGLLNMTAAVTPLSQSETFAQMFVRLADTPVLGFLAGTGVAFLIQSSSATIGILQALSMTGALTFASVYAIIIGVNIGDCVTTAIVCSIGSKADAKRTGVIHILFNIAGSTLIILAVMLLHRFGYLDGLWNRTMTSGGIANIHTVFRLFAAVVLLPVCGKFEQLSRLIVKDDAQIGENVDRELELLDEKFYTSPALALSSAETAIATMARLSRDAVMNAMSVLQKYDIEKIRVINENEDHIDQLADHVDNYLIKLSPHVQRGHGNDLLNFYIQCFSEFERIGDYAVNLTENAGELQEKNAQFSDMALAELGLLRQAMEEILGYTYQGFTALDINAARCIEPVEEVVDDLVATLRSNHIRRLRDGQCTVYAGLTFLDILVNVERVGDQCSNLGVYILSQYDSSIMNNHHDYIQQLHQGKNEEFNRHYQQLHEKYFGQLARIEEGVK
ncbi:MAG: Na/Pi cotransporter family protein [Oscillospiraceae bacterium]|nr:Na/Pi cotransporter family protein [Oscillospiraceae bacterium]